MITGVWYANEAENEVYVAYDSGRITHVTHPSDSTLSQDVQAWVDAGNTIAPYAKPLNEAKDEKQDAIDASYAAAESATVTLGGFDFDADLDAQSETLAVISRVDHGDTLPPGWTWPDTDGVEHTTDAAGMVALFKAINNKHWADRKNYALLTKQVRAATTTAEVEAIPDW